MAEMKKILEVPKRPKTAYILFSTEKRTSLDKSMSVGEQSKILGEMWKNLTAEEKGRYEEAYKKEKENYDCTIKELEQTEEGRTLLDESKKRKRKIRRGAELTEKKPKKVSAYNVFMKERAAQMKEENGNTKLSFKEMVQTISGEWKTMSENDKEQYKLMAGEKNREDN